MVFRTHVEKYNFENLNWLFHIGNLAELEDAAKMHSFPICVCWHHIRMELYHTTITCHVFLPLGLSGRRGIVVMHVCLSVRPSVCLSVCLSVSMTLLAR